MSASWFLLLLAVTVGNLALGFALACLFGHGPTWPKIQALAAPLLAPVRGDLTRMLAIIRFRKSPRSPP